MGLLARGETLGVFLKNGTARSGGRFGMRDESCACK